MSIRIRPLATSITSALQLILHIAASIMLKIVPEKFVFMLSSHLCRGLPLLL